MIGNPSKVYLETIVRRLKAWGAVYRYEEPHRLSGGGTSHTYIDIRHALSTGSRIDDFAFWMRELVEHHFSDGDDPAFDVVHGVAMGGIIPAEALVRNFWQNRGCDIGISWSRPEVKPHTPTRPHCQTSRGIDRLFGADVSGKRVLLIDDVLTTGRTLREERVEVEGNDGVVVGAVVVVDRSEASPFDDIPTHSLLKFEDLK